MDGKDISKWLEAENWYRGELDYLLRRHGQMAVYRKIREWKEANPNRLGPIVLNCHRAFGKSYFVVLLGIERCLKFPFQEVRVSSPTYKQTKEIVAPIITKILARCPDELQPERREGKLVFKNPRWEDPNAISTLYLSTCKDDAESQRGLRSDFIAIDECRDVPNFDYVVKDVYLFHFAQRKNPLMILCSTPPKSPGDHAWSRVYLESARRNNRYIEFPVTMNEDWTEADDEMLVDVCGGKETTSWRREALCELIGDEASLIVPEFQKIRDRVVVDFWERPAHFFPYVCIDTGWVDKTAVLFGYVDFLNQVLVIEDEIVLARVRTVDLAAKILAMEKILYPRGRHPLPIRRFGDMTPQQLNDLVYAMREQAGFSYPVSWSSVEKYDREVSLARLRSGIQNERIKILSCCKHLVKQLMEGTQDEKGRFERSEVHGHFDAIAALQYLFRMVKWQANPFPDERLPSNFFQNPYQKVEKKHTQITHYPAVVTRGRIA
ncbi:MAG: hypothetical protein ACE5EK_00185 [Nitrospinales bacterium]